MNNSYKFIDLTADFQLQWANSATDSTYQTAYIMDISPASAGLIIFMPDGRQSGAGSAPVQFTNVGAYDFTVKTFNNGTPASIVTIATSESYEVYLTDNSTQQGTWGAVEFGGAGSGASASALAGNGLKAISSKLNTNIPTRTFSTSYTLLSTDLSTLLVWSGGTGILTIPSIASLGNTGFYFSVHNAGTGVLTLTPVELIDGESTLLVYPGSSVTISSSTTAWYTLGLGKTSISPFSSYTNDLTGSGGSYTVPSNYTSRQIQIFEGTIAQDTVINLQNIAAEYYIKLDVTQAGFALSIQLAGQPATNISLVEGQTYIFATDGDSLFTAPTALTLQSIEFVDGTAAAPGIFYAMEPGTGFFRATTGIIGVSSNGVENSRFTSTQILHNANGASFPQYSFNGFITSGLRHDGTNLRIDAAAQSIITANGVLSTFTNATQTFLSSTAINLNVTGSGAINIGNSATNTTMLGVANINATGTSATNIGASGSTTTLTGTINVVGATTHTGNTTVVGTTNINATGTSATNIGNLLSVTSLLGVTNVNTTGTSSTNIGNANSSTFLLGTVNLNTSGDADVTIGNITNSFSVNASSFFLGATNINITGVGTTTIGNATSFFVSNASLSTLGNTQIFGTISLNTAGNGVTNIGNPGSTTNIYSPITFLGTANINTTGSAPTNIGNVLSTTTILGPVFINNSGANNTTIGNTGNGSLVINHLNTLISSSGLFSVPTATINLNTVGTATTNIGSSTNATGMQGTLNFNTSGTGSINLGNASSTTNLAGTINITGTIVHTGPFTINGAINLNTSGVQPTNIGNVFSTTTLVGVVNINTAGTANNTTIGTAGFGSLNINHINTYINSTGVFEVVSPTNINVSGAAAINLGNAGTVTTVLGVTNINATGTATTNIGATAGAINLTGTTTVVGITNINLTGATDTNIGNIAGGNLVINTMNSYINSAGLFVTASALTQIVSPTTINLTGAASTQIGNVLSTTTLAGTINITGTIVHTGGFTINGAINFNTTGAQPTNIGNVSSTTTIVGAVNINTAGTANNTTIGTLGFGSLNINNINTYINSTGVFEVVSPTNINATGTATTNIGATASSTNINGTTTVVGTTNLNVTGAGSTTIGNIAGGNLVVNTLNSYINSNGFFVAASTLTQIVSPTTVNLTGAASTQIGNVLSTTTILGPVFINNSGSNNTTIGTAGAGSLVVNHLNTLITSSGLFQVATATISLNTTGTATTNIGSATNATGMQGTLNFNTSGTTGTNIGNVSSTTTIVGAVNINTTGTANNTNIGTLGFGAVNINNINTYINSTGIFEVVSPTNINVTGSALTTIGNAFSTVAINGVVNINTTNDSQINIGQSGGNGDSVIWTKRFYVNATEFYASNSVLMSLQTPAMTLTATSTLTVNSLGTADITSPTLSLNPSGTGATNIGNSGDTTFLKSSTLYFQNISSSAGTALVASGGSNQVYLLTSSLRFKEDIQTLDVDTSKLYELEAVTYKYKGREDRGFGYIAEDVDKLLPCLINYDDKHLPFSINYMQMNVLLLEEMKKLKTENANMNERLMLIEAKLAG